MGAADAAAAAAETATLVPWTATWVRAAQACTPARGPTCCSDCLASSSVGGTSVKKACTASDGNCTYRERVGGGWGVERLSVER